MAKAQSGKEGDQNALLEDEEEEAYEEEEDYDLPVTNPKVKGPSFWTFEYYQQYFDVDTRDVQERILASLAPLPSRNILTDFIRPKPDLYGPFWITTTLVFSTAICANVADYFAAQISSSGEHFVWSYEFNKVSLAATVIYTYWWLMPILIYGFFWYRGVQHDIFFSELLCLYGYSFSIFVPVSVLWVIKIFWFQWLLGVLSALISASVLLLTLWAPLRFHHKHVAYVVCGLLVLSHLALSAFFVLYFFGAPLIPSDTSTSSTSSSSSSGTSMSLMPSPSTSSKPLAPSIVTTIRSTTAKIVSTTVAPSPPNHTG